jgi:hypothetical protein
MTSLAIVERAYRGAVEVAYFDALFLGIEIHRQLGLDVLLRGEAVTYAVDGPAPEPFLVGKRLVETLDAPRADLLRLRDLGVGPAVRERALRRQSSAQGVRTSSASASASRAIRAVASRSDINSGTARHRMPAAPTRSTADASTVSTSQPSRSPEP